MNHICNNVLRHMAIQDSVDLNGKTSVLDIKKVIKNGWRNAFVDLLINELGVTVSDQVYHQMLSECRYFIISEEIDKTQLLCIDEDMKSLSLSFTLSIFFPEINVYKVCHDIHKSETSPNDSEDNSIWHIWTTKKKFNIASIFAKKTK